MSRDKSMAYSDHAASVKNSWTYARMTDDERERYMTVLFFVNKQNMVRGTYEQRVHYLNGVYNAFLAGIGYSGPDWRDPCGTSQSSIWSFPTI